MLEAIDAIESYARGKSERDYQREELLRDGIERRLITVGEAPHRFSREDPGRAAQLVELRQIVALRNVLVHGYDVVKTEQVWKVVREDLPRLRQEVRGLVR